MSYVRDGSEKYFADPKCCACRWYRQSYLATAFLMPEFGSYCGGQAYKPVIDVFNNGYCQKIYEPILKD